MNEANGHGPAFFFHLPTDEDGIDVPDDDADNGRDDGSDDKNGDNKE